MVRQKPSNSWVNIMVQQHPTQVFIPILFGGLTRSAGLMARRLLKTAHSGGESRKDSPASLMAANACSRGMSKADEKQSSDSPAAR